MRELFESAVCMGRQALAAIEVAGEEIDRIEADYRERDARRLTLQREEGTMAAGLAYSYAPGRAAKSLDEAEEEAGV